MYSEVNIYRMSTHAITISQENSLACEEFLLGIISTVS